MLRARRARASGDRGALLVELLVASVVFGVVAMASVQVLVSSSRAQTASQDRAVASRLARSELDVMRSLAGDRLAIDPAATGYVATFEGDATVTVAGGAVVPTGTTFVDGQRFEIVRHVVWEAVGAEPQAYKRIVVVVRWPGGDERLESGVRELGGG